MDIKTYNNFLGENITIVYFYNNKCSDYNEKIKNIKNIIYIDIDKNNSLCYDLYIKSVPFFKIYKNKECIENILGNYKNINDILSLFIV